MNILNSKEYKFLKKKLKRSPNELEQNIINAEWSEHCSYKSSKIHLRTLPTEGKSLIKGAGFDAGVIDVGNGYVITIHIEKSTIILLLSILMGVQQQGLVVFYEIYFQMEHDQLQF